MLFAVLIYFDCHLYTSVSKPSLLVIHQIEKGILELINRARYYHAMLTQSKYDRRRGYAALPDSYVIFICRFDPFGEGRAVYRQEPCILGLERQLPAH